MIILEIASELSSELVDSWKTKITKEFELKDVTIDVRINSELILGYRVIVNNTTYDHSLVNKVKRDLNNINKKIL